MVSHHLPFLVIESPRLIQYSLGYAQLSHVMHKGCVCQTDLVYPFLFFRRKLVIQNNCHILHIPAVPAQIRIPRIYHAYKGLCYIERVLLDRTDKSEKKRKDYRHKYAPSEKNTRYYQIRLSESRDEYIPYQKKNKQSQGYVFPYQIPFLAGRQHIPGSQ